MQLTASPPRSRGENTVLRTGNGKPSLVRLPLKHDLTSQVRSVACGVGGWRTPSKNIHKVLRRSSLVSVWRHTGRGRQGEERAPLSPAAVHAFVTPIQLLLLLFEPSSCSSKHNFTFISIELHVYTHHQRTCTLLIRKIEAQLSILPSDTNGAAVVNN